jgi:hypothetical protein
MSGTDHFWGVLRALRGPGRTLGQVVTNHNTTELTEYTVVWEPEHANGPRVAAYATTNSEGYDWPHTERGWLVGWFNRRHGDDCGDVISLLLYCQIATDDPQPLEPGQPGCTIRTPGG